jgi:hypothetical protein
MVVAAAEFLLLGDCSLVAHSRGSSFGREAAMVQLRPAIDVSVQPKNKMSFIYTLTQVASLPHCGLQEFERYHQIAASRGDEEVSAAAVDSPGRRALSCFGERSADVPEDARWSVCSVAIRMCPCGTLMRSLALGLVQSPQTLLCNVGNVGNVGNVEEGQNSTTTYDYQNEECIYMLAESNGY